MLNLKRHIKSQVINRVSTKGYAKMGTDDESRQVLTSFDLVSLDPAPRLRNGTESLIIARDMKDGKEEYSLADDGREDGKDEVTGKIDPETGEAVALLGANPVARVRDLTVMEEKVKMQEREGEGTCGKSVKAGELFRLDGCIGIA